MERKLRIFVVISTIGDGVLRVPSVILPEEEGVHYVVSWQRGEGDSATESPSAVRGGEGDSATKSPSAVRGGEEDSATESPSAMRGGEEDSATESPSAVRGEEGDSATESPSAVRGGGREKEKEREEVMRLLDERKDVTLTTMTGRGLCRNRNHAIETAIGLLTDPLEDAIFVVADDDERFLPDAFARVREYFIRYARLDVALLRVRDRATSDYLKRYPPQAIRYADRPRWYYPSSVELAFRARLWHAGVRFDERFGLGSARLSSGEEEVFLADALALGLKVWVLPVELCETDADTTGRAALDVKALRSKGAVYGRLLPRWRAFFRALREAASLALHHHRSPVPIFRNIWYGFKYIRS